MRVYDLALMFFRATAALGLLRGGIYLVFDGLRGFAILSVDGKPATLVLASVYLASPVEQLIIAIIVLAVSRPLARFAAKLSASSDAAAQF